MSEAAVRPNDSVGQGIRVDADDTNEQDNAGEASWLDWLSQVDVIGGVYAVYDTVEALTRSFSFCKSAGWMAMKKAIFHSQLWGEYSTEDGVAYNRQLALDALDTVLYLKGYYIKAAQTLCGAGVFPDEFDDVFSVLLDQCPSEPFPVVKEIVEKELGCSLYDVFSSFDETATAAASIGQVHFAVLKDGTPVAVKVQYPDVERFFHMDVRMIATAVWLQGMGNDMLKVLDKVEEHMAAEFDYIREAAVMRECAEAVAALYDKSVCIPFPLDARHPLCASGLMPPLCTRKVLVMDRLFGQPVKVYTTVMIELFAEVHGLRPDDLKKMLRTIEPTKFDEHCRNNKALKQAMGMAEASEYQSHAIIAGVRIRNLLGKMLETCSCLPQVSQQSWCQKRMVVPINGVKTTRLLFDVHGYEIFEVGIFNSDPHAGNVLVMTDGRLGLLDYGAVQRLTVEERTCIARLLIALADEDDDAVPDALFDCGFRSTNNDRRLALLAANLFFNRGPYAPDMNRIAPKVEMPQDIDLVTLDGYIRGGVLDSIEEFPCHLVMLQRCSMVLSGVGMMLGAGRMSAARGFRPQAQKWLEAQLLARNVQ